MYEYKSGHYLFIEKEGELLLMINRYFLFINQLLIYGMEVFLASKLTQEAKMLMEK